MEALIGTIIGGIIAGAAMLINAYYSAKRQEEREDHLARRNILEKDIDSLDNLYQESLKILDRLIRKKGMDNDANLEKFYNLEVKLQLAAPKEIFDEFKAVKIAVATMAGKLTPYPEEFIPKFEDDSERYERLEARKSAESTREKEAQTYLPAIFKKYETLTELMKNDLSQKKKLQP